MNLPGKQVYKQPEKKNYLRHYLLYYFLIGLRDFYQYRSYKWYCIRIGWHYANGRTDAQHGHSTDAVFTVPWES